jgi:hypothetical protein
VVNSILHSVYTLQRGTDDTVFCVVRCNNARRLDGHSAGGTRASREGSNPGVDSEVIPHYITVYDKHPDPRHDSRHGPPARAPYDHHPGELLR